MASPPGDDAAMQIHLPSAKSCAVAFAVLVAPVVASAVEVYGGGGTTGAELGLAQSVVSAVSVRLEVDALRYSTSFTTSGIDYDARFDATNAGGDALSRDRLGPP